MRMREVSQNQNQRESILIVDDANDTLEVLRRNLTDEGFKVFTASNVPSALSLLSNTSIDLVITDYKMPKISGLDLIKHVRDNYSNTEIMMITGYSSVEGAVEAIKAGAEEYLSKPFTEKELIAAVERALKKLYIRRADQVKPASRDNKFYGLIGESSATKNIFKMISKAAKVSATILITGESGTGKELVARAIHYDSARAAAPFVPVNCGGIPETLLESELFGHVKGAFTGATESRAGFFQTAEKGTIFLDEISETSLSMQVKLLRVLQEKEISMVGSSRTRKVDVRIISATNKNLPNLVKNEVFREDLFYRLNVISIDVPPLRDRDEDILILAKHFVDKFARELDRPALKFSNSAKMALRNYDWPGNVRELENLIQRLVVMSDRKIIDVADLPSQMRFSALRGAGLDRTLSEVEIDYIRNVLSNTKGNKTKAAKILGIDRKTLREKLNKIKDISI